MKYFRQLVLLALIIATTQACSSESVPPPQTAVSAEIMRQRGAQETRVNFVQFLESLKEKGADVQGAANVVSDEEFICILEKIADEPTIGDVDVNNLPDECVNPESSDFDSNPSTVPTARQFEWAFAQSACLDFDSGSTLEEFFESQDIPGFSSQRSAWQQAKFNITYTAIRIVCPEHTLLWQSNEP